MDEGSFRVINNQPLNPSEEKEIVCRTDYLTPLTVDPPIQSCCCSLMEWLKRYCLTYLHCGFDPLLHLLNTNKQMIMKYIIEFLSFAVLTLLCLYSFTILMVMI